jgi:NAD+ kinase
VVGSASRLRLAVEAGHVPVRYELDGRRADIPELLVEIGHRPDYATLVELAEEEPRLTGLRRRGLVVDSPRVLVHDARSR